MVRRKKEEKEFNLSDVIGGTLNILGLKIDLAKLLSSPEDIRKQLEELRKKLKQAGGKEVLSDEEWRRGGISIGGHLRTRGILGDAEYHIGTTARPQRRAQRAPQPLEAVEPAVDFFDEPEEVLIVAEVPGVSLEDLELRIEDNILSLSTKPAALRNYKK